MRKEEVKTIVKTFYEKLEEGIILGRKCPACGHIEYPPYLICNSCGNLDTEWVELNNMKTMCNQILPPAAAFAEPEFRANIGDYWVAAVQPEGADESGTCLVNIDPERYDEYRAKLPFEVKPVIVQDVDTKIVLWEPADAGRIYVPPYLRRKAGESSPEEMIPAAAPAEVKAEAAPVPAAKPQPSSEPVPAAAPQPEEAPAPEAEELDEIAMVVIDCAAEAYGVDADTITLATDIREDLANQSMKMIAMLAGIEDQLDVTIEISEAGNLNTIGDFVQCTREKMK